MTWSLSYTTGRIYFIGLYHENGSSDQRFHWAAALVDAICANWPYEGYYSCVVGMPHFVANVASRRWSHISPWIEGNTMPPIRLPSLTSKTRTAASDVTRRMKFFEGRSENNAWNVDRAQESKSWDLLLCMHAAGCGSNWWGTSMLDMATERRWLAIGEWERQQLRGLSSAICSLKRGRTRQWYCGHESKTHVALVFSSIRRSEFRVSRNIIFLIIH